MRSRLYLSSKRAGGGGGGAGMNQEIDQWQTSCQANDKGERVWCTSVNTSTLVLL